jgi:muramoyltetrapeptide carboxypeptidase
MNIPPFLKSGDAIGIVATARKVSLEEINPAISILEEWGLIPVIGKTIGLMENQFAGNDLERMEDLQRMLDDDNIKAIILARGGYGTVRIIDQLDFTDFIKHPKWICGFSDVTVLHSHINMNFNIATIHSPMCFNFPKAVELNTLKKALIGDELKYIIPSDELNIKGNAMGELIGGNLSILYSLVGSKSDINTDGKILFLEDLDEYLYHIDRMMMNLKRSGKLANLKGIIVGGMTDMKDNTIPFGKTAEEIILDAVKEYDYPVCFSFPAGHVGNNSALIMGGMVSLDVNDVVNISFKD